MMTLSDLQGHFLFRIHLNSIRHTNVQHLTTDDNTQSALLQ